MFPYKCKTQSKVKIVSQARCRQPFILATTHKANNEGDDEKEKSLLQKLHRAQMGNSLSLQISSLLRHVTRE